ncbi:MAG: cadherin-like beta sandwich domain-containing protein [Erysipelotrichaceae bacterium]|jgi:hypothetical protein|nr:cadherin-like beta sandwich domain-containing protein [Erysipelotrichaceae bacterium]
MSKFMHKFFIWISSGVLGLCMFLQCIQPVHAQFSASVWANASTAYVGDSVTFTVSVSGAAGSITVSGAASDYDWFDNSSKSYTVKANAVGKLTVSINGLVADYDTGLDQNISTSATVNVIPRPSSSGGGNSSNNVGNPGNSGGNVYDPSNETADPKSSDNTLSSLTVSRGTLDPVFDSAVTEYKLVLSADTTSLTVEATANDSKANVSGTGEKSVKPGDNKLTVVVTAEDGSEKTYVINAYVDEKPTAFMKVNGKDYGVITNVDSVSSPYGFEKTTLNYSGQEIPAWKNSVSNITLVYLIDEKSEKNFYIYEGDRIISVYKPIALLGNNLAIIDIPEDMQVRKGMVFGEVEIDGQKMPGWRFENEAFSDYSLVYLMNEKGEKVFYQYEKNSNTLQPYSGAAAVTQEAYEDILTQNLYLMIGAGTFGGLAVIFLILWLRSRHQSKNNKKTVKKEMPKNDKLQVKKEADAKPITQRKEEQPTYHRQHMSSSGRPAQTHHGAGGNVDDSLTQPFRFHDDFDNR